MGDVTSSHTPVCDSVHSHVSVQGGLCPGDCVHGSLCPGGGSLSRRGVSVQGVSVQGGLCPGGLCPGGSLSRGLCPGESLSRRGVSVQERVSVQGSLSRGSLLREVSVREIPSIR